MTPKACKKAATGPAGSTNVDCTCCHGGGHGYCIVVVLSLWSDHGWDSHEFISKEGGKEVW